MIELVAFISVPSAPVLYIEDCSVAVPFVKVNVDLDKAKEFKAALEEIGEIFWETKK